MSKVSVRNSKTTTQSFRMPNDLADSLDRYLAETGRTKTEFYNDLVKSSVEGFEEKRKVDLNPSSANNIFNKYLGVGDSSGAEEFDNFIKQSREGSGMMEGRVSKNFEL